MTKESLDSDKVNLLIWRYLIEQGYRETAVRLQKEWNLDDPQQLPYASYISNHALVRALNKGLLYNAIERECHQNQDPHAPVTGVFGPLTLPTRPVPAPTHDEAVDVENVRKRQILEDESVQPRNNGPKRQRITNGYENGFEVVPPKSPMAMDLDEEPQNRNGNAYPSPELLPSPVPATNGPEKGTQIEKVADLTAYTTFLDLSDDSSSASRNTILLQCEFSPQDPTLLAVAGTDALARMWNLSPPRVTLEGDVQMNRDHNSPRYSNLLDEGVSSKTTATLISWAPNGSCIAVASEPMDSEAARVEVWTTDNTSVALFESFYPPIISLLWNPNSSLILTISPAASAGPSARQGTLLKIMTSGKFTTVDFHLPNHNLDDQILDAIWTSDLDFVICGGDMLQAFTLADGVIEPTRKYETRHSHRLSKVTFDVHSGLLATASDTGIIDIWSQQGETRSFNAHQGGITALVWQPIPNPSPLPEDSERLLASAGEDGAISIWNAKSLDTKSKSSMTMANGVVGLSFSPEGVFVAGATSEQILIWKVEDVNLPRASWNRGTERGWQTPRSQDSLEIEDQHTLCWAADGQTLAYGVNSLLALIKFRP